jgi:hypothetical protein
MKTIKFLSTVTAAVIVAITSAVERPKMELTPLSVDRAVVSVTNENPALFEMSIKAINGDLVYYKQSEQVSTSYQKTFDFKDLEKGKYVMNVKVNDTKVTREFEVGYKGIIVGDSKLRFDPYFSFKNDQLKFSYLNFDEEYFWVSLYQNGEKVYSRKIGNDIAIQKGFDLSNVAEGDYRVVLSSMNNEFVYNLNK